MYLSTKNKKGFTLIELLAVIAILAILVLLASPAISGAKEKARLAHIKNDIKVAEGVLAEFQLDEKNIHLLPTASIDGSKVYSKKGEANPRGKTLYDITGMVESNLTLKGTNGNVDKGFFLANEDGSVFYTEDADTRPINSYRGGHFVSGAYNGSQDGGAFRNDKPVFQYNVNISKDSADGVYVFMLLLKDKKSGKEIEKKYLTLTKEDGTFYKPQGFDFKHTKIEPTRENLSLSINIEKPEGEFAYILEKEISFSNDTNTSPPNYTTRKFKLELSKDSWIEGLKWVSQ